MLTVRNLTSKTLSITRIERFEDPNTSKSKAVGYFFASRNTTSTSPSAPELGEHAQTFNHQDLSVRLGPFESYDLRFPGGDLGATTTSSTSTLRLTVELAGGERHRVDTNPSYTQKCALSFTPLAPNPAVSLTALFHPTKPVPHLTIRSDRHTDYTQWMQKIPDEFPLSALSIPGTHNSHTHYRALPSVKCQCVDVKTQLERGIRFLDIRAQPAHATDAGKKDMYLVHGAFPVSLTGAKYLAPVLETCYRRPKTLKENITKAQN